MSLDDTGGFSLTNPAESASPGEAGGGGQIGGDGPTMTGNDLGGRTLVQARVQVVVQGVAGMRLPIGGRLVCLESSDDVWIELARHGGASPQASPPVFTTGTPVEQEERPQPTPL